MKAAVIGCGRMGAFTSSAVLDHAPSCWFPLSHADAIASHERLELVAICDPGLDSLARAAKAFPDARAYSDHRAMLADVDPDLVCIATRTPGRTQIIADCVKAGVRALHVEKPLCNSSDELNSCEQLLSEGSAFLTLGAIRRHMKIYQQANDMARSGHYGHILEVRLDFGPGKLFWTQPHAVDLALMVAGGATVVGVQAVLEELVFQLGDADTVVNDPTVQSATIWFQNGLAAHIGRAPGSNFFIACEHGVIGVLGDGGLLTVSSGAGKNSPYLASEAWPPPVSTGPQGTFAALDQLVRCLEGCQEAQFANTALRRDIFVGQAILFAMVRSHRAAGALVELGGLATPPLTVLAKSGANYA